MMIIDIHEPDRVNRTPDAIEVLLSDGNFTQDNFKISRVELRLYNEKTNWNTRTTQSIKELVNVC